MAKSPGRASLPAKGLERVVFFSDAVMAIAITLLVLELKVPGAEAGPAAGFGERLLALWPKALGYAVSFWVIALYWVAHHRCFERIRDYDRRLIYANFLFLMFIAFLPFPTALLFSDPSHFAAVALYAGTAAGMGLSLALVWERAVRHRFVQSGLRPALVRDIRLNLLLPPLLFLASIGLAAFSVQAAMYAWLLMVPIYVFRRVRESSLARGQ